MSKRRKYKWDFYRQVFRIIPTFSLIKDEEILQNGDALYFRSIERRHRSHQVLIRQRELTKD